MTRPLTPFGEWLAMMLERRGWKPIDLARELETNRAAISKWMHYANYRPEPKWCAEIANVLGVPLYMVYAANEIPYDGLLGLPSGNNRRAVLGILMSMSDPEVDSLLASLTGHHNRVQRDNGINA